MNRPLISYVVTAYNIEQFIKEAIECAFAQTYSPLEIILSDDCSTDGTFEIMKEMAADYHGPHKIKLNRNEQNLGITRHMNKAYLELAEGEIIIAAHGDDISIPKRTELSYKFLISHPDVNAVSLSMKSINSNGVKIVTDDACVESVKFYDFESGANIPAPSRAFYKRVMTVFGPLANDCPTEDELITTRALMLGRNAFLPDVGVYYRKHKMSSSNPENFRKFPLDKILGQQICDLNKGVRLGLITKYQADSRIAALKLGLNRRIKYRAYFTNPTFYALIKLIGNPLFPLRTKLYYIVDHFRRQRSSHSSQS
jgi:glycosyltransferase, family 2